jgi:hypothetical protein
MWFVGSGLWAALSAFNVDFIKYAGKLNTFGGEDVKGLNIDTYYIQGQSQTIAIVQDPLLNEATLGGLSTMCTIPGYTNYTIGQMTGMLISDIPVRDQTGMSVPVLKKWHFGESEYSMGVMQGIESNGFASIPNGSANSMLTNDSLAVATLQDVSQVGIIHQYALDGTGYGMGWIEPINP